MFCSSEFDAIAMSRGGMSSSSRDGEDGAEGGGGSGLCRKLLAELLLQLTECKQLAILSPDSDSTQGPRGTAIEQTPMKPNRNSSSSSVEGAAGSKRSRYSPYTVSPPSPMQQSFSPEADQDGEESYHPLRSAQAAPAAPLPPARPMVVVIAATNRPTDIDPAVLRRFESKINVLPPSQEERAAVFARYLRQVEHSLTAAQLARLADQTEGWTGCDIENFTREAAMAPVRRAFPMARATDAGGGQDGDRDCRERTVAALEASTATVAPITVEDFRKNSHLVRSCTTGTAVLCSAAPTCFNTTCLLSVETAWENMILRNQY
jgi:SpoVK/Ycf46/Vps4 family AAA+-type ATPase